MSAIDVWSIPEKDRKALERAGLIPRAKKGNGVTSKTTARKDIPKAWAVQCDKHGFYSTGESGGCVYCPEREGEAHGESSKDGKQNP